MVSRKQKAANAKILKAIDKPPKRATSTLCINCINRTRRRVERNECPVHEFVKHGKEAQELRAGVEKLLMFYDPDGQDLSGEDAKDLLEEMCTKLQSLLDEVDARDSLAYVERQAKD